MTVFVWPWAFVALPLPWLIWRFWRAALPGRALRLPYQVLQTSAPGPRARTPRLVVMLLALAWLGAVAAAARPQWVGPPQAIKRSGRALMLAVDISGSMALKDMRVGGHPVSRFADVEAIAGDFISRRQGDQMGLILFGSQAYLVTPLTFDLSAVRAQLDGAAVGLAGRETAIGDAVAVAVRRLRKLPAKARVLILLTDGVNTAGALDPKTAIQLAKAAGVRIYTIGIGATHMQVQGFFGSQVVNPSADLDTDMLTHMASETGGKFFRATDSHQLAEAYRAIDRLEPVAHDNVVVRERDELFRWPLGAALVLGLMTALAAALPARRSRA
ncbi:VWA domain-containing protein [Oleiagrimonas sp. C23AA]|uniref:VWA domain-containing protein n=1 Tax=Oleiagrimonas sp. C23AA TaxID=2719047 RepID=UPI00141DA8F2|nr:VWA domain-containing protein [Oleiagrimonas sp. C23AA]NII09819.1 VWA domain-containing protein [Oleiagrimonas sp. C23AA]